MADARVFDGKRYMTSGVGWTTRKNAATDARLVRQSGRLARVTKLKGSYIVWVGPLAKRKAR